MWVLVRPIEIGRAVVAACRVMTFFIGLLGWARSRSFGRLVGARWFGGNRSVTSAGGQLDLDALSLTRDRGCIDVVLAVSGLFTGVSELAKSFSCAKDQIVPRARLRLTGQA